MQLLDEWISESCEILSGDLDENAPSLETVKAIESDLSVQKDHLEVFTLFPCLGFIFSHDVMGIL